MATETRIVLVRHAETDWNFEQRFQGHTDTPLNELGRTRIGPVIEALRSWDPEIIITSDLSRAREMAEEAGVEFGLDVIAREDLRECSYGSWEGKTLKEVRQDHGGDLDSWQSNEAGFQRGDGESLLEMQERTLAAIESIAREHAGRTVVIFSHSGPVRSVICRAFDLPIDQRYRFEVSNASLSAIRPRGDREWQVLLLNQTNHLGTEPGMISPVASQGGGEKG
ncbi:histidine phosphatase family protein [Gemmatimonadota bacterium]